MINLPPQIFRFFIEKAMRIGRENNQVCPYWYDQDILDAICHEDRKMEKQLKEKYLSKCHEPNVKYIPSLGKVYVGCQSCDIRSGIRCNAVFPLIEEMLLKEIREILEKET